MCWCGSESRHDEHQPWYGGNRPAGSMGTSGWFLLIKWLWMAQLELFGYCFCPCWCLNVTCVKGQSWLWMRESVCRVYGSWERGPRFGVALDGRVVRVLSLHVIWHMLLLPALMTFKFIWLYHKEQTNSAYGWPNQKKHAQAHRNSPRRRHFRLEIGACERAWKFDKFGIGRGTRL